MSQPTRARQDLRLDVLKKLDPTSEPKSSSCTSDSDARTVIKDTALAPLGQGMDYRGYWAYIRSQPTKVDSTRTVNESPFAAGDTTLTVSSSTGILVGDGLQIEDEIIRVTTVTDGTTLEVVRGIQGTTDASHATGLAIYIIGPAVGEIASVVNVEFGSTNSYLTVKLAFSASPVDTQEYELHRKVRPSTINDRLDVILGLLRQNVLLPVTIVADGDMEASGVSDWTGINATPLKDTTFVRRGRNSLKVTASAADGYVLSSSAYLPGGTECILEADVYITAGDSVKLLLRDQTSDETIGTAMESDEEGWVHLEGRFTLPATCKIVGVHAIAQGNGDVIYFDHVTLWPTYDQGIELPSFLEFVYDVKELFYLPVGTGLAGSTNVGAYRINEGSPQFYAHYSPERDDTAVVSARFYVEGSRPPNALWLKGRKPYPAFSGATDALKDVDTTQAHKNVVANMTAASIFDDLAIDATEAEKPQLSEALQVKALVLRNEIAGILASMTPPKKKVITTPFTRPRRG